jgi:hypothetical protein
MPDQLRAQVVQRLHAIAKTLLQGGAREVESVADMIDLVDEPNLPLLIRGDVSLGAVVRCAGAVVVEGKVEGVSDMPCRILAEGPVVVMGNVKHAHIRAREAQFWAHGERFDKSDGTMSVLGVVMPHFRLCFSRLIKNEMLDSDVQAELSRSEMMLRPGKRRGTHEVVLKHNNEAVDLLFITPEQVQKVEFTAVNDRIEWSSVL